MKLTLLAALLVTAVASPVAVSAVECTDKQLEGLGAANNSNVQTVCPSLFIEGKDAIDPTNADSLTADALKNLSPCKDAACVKELTKFVDLSPDCTVVGLNIKATYHASLKLCEAFTQGNVTVAKATEIFGDVIKNASSAFEAILGGDGSSAGKAPTVTAPSNSSEQTPSAPKPGPAGSPASTSAAPTPTPKSTASMTSVAGLAVVVAMSLATSLLL